MLMISGIDSGSGLNGMSAACAHIWCVLTDVTDCTRI